MAMPLLVQLHLRPGPQLDLAIVRQELLQGAFHALHHLCMQHGATTAVPRRSKPSSRVQSQAAPVTCRCIPSHAVTRRCMPLHALPYRAIPCHTTTYAT